MVFSSWTNSFQKLLSFFITPECVCVGEGRRGKWDPNRNRSGQAIFVLILVNSSCEWMQRASEKIATYSLDCAQHLGHRRQRQRLRQHQEVCGLRGCRHRCPLLLCRQSEIFRLGLITSTFCPWEAHEWTPIAVYLLLSPPSPNKFRHSVHVPEKNLHAF